MTDAKYSFLGFLISVSLILNVVAVFTPNWTSQQLDLRFSGVAWLIAASVLIIAALVLSVLTIAIYFFVYFRIKNDDYSEELRKWFRIIELAALLSVISTITAIILIARNCSLPYRYYSRNYDPVTLGFSAWLSLIAAVLTLGVLTISEHIASEEC